MFGRKKLGELEARIERLERAVREVASYREDTEKELEYYAEVLASFEERLSKAEGRQEHLAMRHKAERDARIALANREARHEMRVKERMDEYALAIIDLENGRSPERQTLSEMVADKPEWPMSTAQLVDEWVNGKEGADDE